MWIGDRIWFCSDRTGTLNLWSYDPQARRTWILWGVLLLAAAAVIAMAWRLLAKPPEA